MNFIFSYAIAPHPDCHPGNLEAALADYLTINEGDEPIGLVFKVGTSCGIGGAFILISAHRLDRLVAAAQIHE